jgi:hypothetical protein
MKVEEAKGVCKDRSKWKEVISANPMGNGRVVMYVCMYAYKNTSGCYADTKEFLYVIYI